MDELLATEVMPAAGGANAERRFHAFCRWAAGATAAVGLAVLAGWAFDVTVLKCVHPDLVAMKANTAAAFILSGAALWLLLPRRKRTAALRAGQACAVLAALIGAATMAEYFLGIKPGLDEVLFKDSPNALATLHPGRMAMLTAAGFLLIGLALLLLDADVGDKRFPAEPLAVLLGFIGLLALIGYLYGVKALYGRTGGPTTMSLHTAVLFCLLSAAVLCARPGRGLMGLLTSSSLGGATLRRLLPATVVLVLLLGWLRAVGERAAWFDPLQGAALFAALGMVVTVVIVWIAARHLERADEERRKAREVILAREQHWRSLVQVAPSAIVCLSADRRIEEFNPEAERLYGKTRGQALGRDYLETFVPEAARKAMAEAVRQALHGRPVRELECAVTAADGSERTMSWYMDRLIDEKGRASGVIAVGYDVTQRKQAEEQLRRTMDDLARSNRELEQFAYVASHDLKEPLRKVQSFTELLAQRYKGQTDEKTDRYVGHIVDGSQRMQRLIDDLLAYSRVGRSEMKTAPTDLNAIFQRVTHDLGTAIQEKKAVVESDPLPTVNANDAQIGLVLQNLIANGIKFHGAEPPRVRVSAERRGAEWVLCVRDNGIGVDPKHFEKLFQIFQRLHAAGEYPGTGIGLAVCKKIIERHGGRIWIESEPGKGAAFLFTLPPAA